MHQIRGKSAPYFSFLFFFVLLAMLSLFCCFVLVWCWWIITPSHVFVCETCIIAKKKGVHVFAFFYCCFVLCCSLAKQTNKPKQQHSLTYCFSLFVGFFCALDQGKREPRKPTTTCQHCTTLRGDVAMLRPSA